MSRSNRTKLLVADTYAHDLASAITSAERSISIITTTLRSDDERSEAIIAALCSAADRGVTVSVFADTFTYLEPKEFILFYPRRQPARALRAIQLERRLKSHGIKFHWLGRKANIIITGRTHSKWAVVDDTVYSFGGVNLDRESFDNIDYVFRIQNPTLAKLLTTEQQRIYHADKGGAGIFNHTTELDKKTKIHIDGGLIGGSRIYRRAYQLALEASSITLVSQYCPTGFLMRILTFKKATLYYNHWRNASLANRVLIGLGMLTSRSATYYHHDAYLHAKFVLFTMADGTKVALSGSHNFMRGGGILGTREIAIETTDPAIITQLEAFLEQHVA